MNNVILEGAFAGGDVAIGTFCGGEIEPGTFHRLVPHCVYNLVTNASALDEHLSGVGSSDEEPDTTDDVMPVVHDQS